MTPRIDRLRVLADYLENEVADERFDIRHWRCGTAACAMGHACSIPEFKKDGLMMELETPKYIGPSGSLFGFKAAERFFGISRKDSRHLFDLGYYAVGRETRMDVVRRIREFIARSETAELGRSEICFVRKARAPGLMC